MRDIADIAKQYDIKINEKHQRANASVREGNILKYNTIPDLFFLASNSVLKKVECPISKRGIMVDLSRGKVLTIETLKQMIVKSMCFGFNTMTIYIEDLLKIDEYEQYGYLRGKFSDQEIDDLVSFAKCLEYELVPAIQTLGHLEHFLRWDASAPIKGTEYVLKTDEEKSYDFIDAVIKKVTILFGTKVINIGMDEAFDLGFWKPNTEILDQKQIFLEHLNRVNEICEKYKVENVKVWSDMLFSIHSNTDGENLYSNNFNTNISKVDENIELIYWNYWTKNKEEYSNILQIHKKFSNKVSMALAIHTSMNLFYDYNQLVCTKEAIPACIENGINEVLFTMWYEDGGICNTDSIYLGMYETMCTIFNLTPVATDFEKICKINYDNLLTICKLKDLPINPIACLWNDPLYNIYYRKFSSEELNTTIIQLEEMRISNPRSGVEIYYSDLIEYLQLDIKRYMYGMSKLEKVNLLQLYNNISEYIIMEWINEAKMHGIEDIQKRFELKKYRYQFENDYQIKEDNRLEGNIKPRFVQLYSPNKWR